METNILTTIRTEHSHKWLEVKAYVALLSKPTGKFSYDRVFMTKQAFKNNYFRFYFKWDITIPGVYEMKEQRIDNDLVNTTYFAVNTNGDIIALKDKKEVQSLIFSNTDTWSKFSKLKIQINKANLIKVK